ncbi:PP2C family protein-serine/threonine phosphatase [Nitrosophilus labii]|uniref:PP2C family protein-serine/threonine phosphatase n=1 Tax=Nitrosophilus labii TaxID=2706014 RepID=UPI001656EB36|nr:PP2C family serine/threonine-protein phosphatase [Nitrosophilus labii]
MLYVSYCCELGSVRRKNEDLLLIDDEIVQKCSQKEIKNDHFLTVVADGLGGHKAGMKAARTVLECLKQKKPSNRQMIVATLIEAKRELEEIAAKEIISLATALAGIVWKKNEALIFNVGDCRVYKVSPQNIEVLTKDHTLVNELQSIGLKHQNSNILTSSISGGIGIEEFEIFFSSTAIEKGEKLLICSDGFWREFENEIQEIVMSSNILKIFERIKKRKKLSDNVSFIVVEQKLSFVKRVLDFLKKGKNRCE